MVELKKALIGPKRKKISEVDLLVNNEITPIEKKEVFQFLLLKDQYLEEGGFSIDGVNILPEIDDGYSLYSLKINSAFLVVNTLFLLKNENKKEKTKEINNTISSLKEITDGHEKVNAIFNKLKALNVSYICLDYEDEVNKENRLLIDEILKNVTDLCVLTYEEPIIEEVVVTENNKEEITDNFGDEILVLDINDSLPNQETKVKRESKNPLNRVYSNQKSFLKFDCLKTNKKGKFFIFLKDNYSIFLFLLVSVMGFIGSLLLSPMFFSNNVPGFGVVFLIASLFCLVIHLLNLADVFHYQDIKDDYKKTRNIFGAISSAITLVIGSGLGVGFFFLIKNISKSLSANNYSFWHILPALGVFIFVLLAPLYIKYIRKLIAKIVKLFKKDKKEE